MTDKAVATQTESREPARLDEWMQSRSAEIGKMLPAHIPEERFMRTVLTAINLNPELANAERRSLFTSCVLCAGDGLYPDGREAALVIFNKKARDANGREEWLPHVQYMPMIAGVRKMLRNTGEVLSATAEVVHENDTFGWTLGDNPSITHVPTLEKRGAVVGAYAIIKLVNGETLREYMPLEEIDKVRDVSKTGKSANGPWAQWFGEMARKTVLRRCAKSAPSSPEAEGLWLRDDSNDEEIRAGGGPPARPKAKPKPKPRGKITTTTTKGEPDMRTADGKEAAAAAEAETVGDIVDDLPPVEDEGGGEISDEAETLYSVVSSDGEVIWQGASPQLFAEKMAEHLHSDDEKDFEKSWLLCQSDVLALKETHPAGLKALADYITKRREPKPEPESDTKAATNGSGKAKKPLTMTWADGKTQDFPATKKGLTDLLVALDKSIAASPDNFGNNAALLASLGAKNKQFSEQIERMRARAYPEAQVDDDEEIET